MTYSVLHVDDEADIREIVQIALELDSDFRVQSVASGPEALAYLERSAPDLILLDMMMPQMDGPATLKAIRENGHGDIPIVFMTARAQSDETLKLISIGAAGVIAKPFDPLALALELGAYFR